MNRSCLAGLLSALAACTGDAATSDTVDTSPIPEVETLAVTADGRVFVDLVSGTVTDLTPEQAASDATGWNLAFSEQVAFSNGGASGSGLCVMGLGPSAPDDAVSHLEALFDGLPSLSGDSWQTVFGEAWHNYNPVDGVFTAVPGVGYMVRGGEGTSYGRLRFLDMDFPSRDAEGVKSFTISIEVQPSGTDAFADTPVLFEGSIPGDEGDVCFDMDSATTVACEGTAWDVLLGFVGREFYMRSNSGLIGGGDGGAIGPYGWEELAAWTRADQDPDAMDVTGEYRVEEIVSVVSENPWFSDEQLTPNYQIYVLQTDASDDSAPSFAFQLLGVTDGNLQLRYRALTAAEVSGS